MTGKNLWNIRGREWLDSLKDIAANAEDDDITTELTQFEKNLMADLKNMVNRPEDNDPRIPDKKDHPIFIGINDAARIMDVSPQTIRNRIRHGLLPAMLISNAHILKTSDVEQLLEKESCKRGNSQ